MELKMSDSGIADRFSKMLDFNSFNDFLKNIGIDLAAQQLVKEYKDFFKNLPNAKRMGFISLRQV